MKAVDPRARSNPASDEHRFLMVARRTAHHIHSLYAAIGLLLTVGLATSLVAMWGLSNLTEDVIEGDTVRLDEAVLTWLNSHASPTLDHFALEITALGNTVVIVVLAVVVASLLLLLRQRGYALLLTLSVSGAGVITPVPKAIFDRSRPQLFEWRVHFDLTSAAYPSGHATMSMATFLTVAYIIYRLSTVKLAAWCAALIASFLIVLIGLSRLYLGVHYPSDVLAGYVVGFVWSVFCAIAVEVLARRNELRHERRHHTTDS